MSGVCMSVLAMQLGGPRALSAEDLLLDRAFHPSLEEDLRSLRREMATSFGTCVMVMPLQALARRCSGGPRERRHRR